MQRHLRGAHQWGEQRARLWCYTDDGGKRWRKGVKDRRPRKNCPLIDCPALVTRVDKHLRIFHGMNPAMVSAAMANPTSTGKQKASFNATLKFKGAVTFVLALIYSFPATIAL